MTTTLAKVLPKLVSFVLVLPFAAGCTKTYSIRPVPPPQTVYGAATKTEPGSLGVTDARSATGKPLNKGTLNVELEGMGDEIAYLGENLARVLNAEGIKVTYTTSASADVTLKVLTYRIRNLRTSGFSPYHTFTTFSADVTTGGPPQRITSFFKNSKTPVWSFNEIERPCYQVPVEVVVKEIAAKLNAHVFGRVASMDTLNKIVNSIPTGPADAATELYLNVLELGYTNNPAAIEPLVRLTERKETLMRAAAVSALGMLGAKEQFPLLRKIYDTDEGVVKSMAVKAIGDLGTPEAAEFLRGVKQSKDYDDETIREVVDLYL